MFIGLPLVSLTSNKTFWVSYAVYLSSFFSQSNVHLLKIISMSIELASFETRGPIFLKQLALSNYFIASTQGFLLGPQFSSYSFDIKETFNFQLLAFELPFIIYFNLKTYKIQKTK